MGAQFFGNAKVREFVKCKNFDGFFYPYLFDIKCFPNPEIKNPLPGVQFISSGSFFILFLFNLVDQ